MSKEKEYELIQDDILVAGTSGLNARQEIEHYATMYGQDAPVEIYEVTRVKIYPVDMCAPSAANGAEMPELPEPSQAFYRQPEYFTADQMQAYARVAVLAERAACAAICDGLSAEVDKYPAQCAAAIRART